jgi:transposase
MARHGLTDREWVRLKPLLPPRPSIGRPAKDHRLILDALLWLEKQAPTTKLWRKPSNGAGSRLVWVTG